MRLSGPAMRRDSSGPQYAGLGSSGSKVSAAVVRALWVRVVEAPRVGATPSVVAAGGAAPPPHPPSTQARTAQPGSAGSQERVELLGLDADIKLVLRFASPRESNPAQTGVDQGRSSHRAPPTPESALGQ